MDIPASGSQKPFSYTRQICLKLADDAVSARFAPPPPRFRSRSRQAPCPRGGLRFAGRIYRNGGCRDDAMASANIGTIRGSCGGGGKITGAQKQRFASTLAALGW